MLIFIEVPDLLIMPSALDTSPDPPQPATPPNTPQPPTQQGSAPQRVNDMENRRQAETPAAPGSQNSAASNGASIPSYGLEDLIRGSNAASAAQLDPTSNDTH
jgi:hypothetical protein